MAISIDIQRIRSAEAQSIKDDYTEFDTVEVFTDTSAPDWEGFARDLLDEWPVRDVDGSELFEAALRNGMIRKIEGGYDPEQHIDAEGICPEKGDPWYEYAFGTARAPTVNAELLEIAKTARDYASDLANGDTFTMLKHDDGTIIFKPHVELGRSDLARIDAAIARAKVGAA
jgi:hypothetical protein